MPSTNDRLASIRAYVESRPDEPFPRYGLAMEYKKLGRTDDALAAFEALRAADPGYVPQYLMAGQMLADTGRSDAAQAWLSQGIEQARAVGNAHALSELEGALATLG